MLVNALAVTHSTPIGSLFSDKYKVNTFDSNTSLQDVFLHFTQYACDAVIIVEEAILIGIMTLKDMIKALNHSDNLYFPVKNFMSTPLHTFQTTMSVAAVLDEMIHAAFDKIVVTKENEVVGVMDRRHLLSVCYNQLTPFIKHEYNMLNSLMGMVNEGKKGLLKMATTDTLTGIGNRRLLEEVFQAHQSLEERYGVTLFLLMFDIDDFKVINDTYGHNTGDLVLKELTALVSNSIRKSDLFVRWGGEEFAILLRYSDPLTVIKIAEQIRKRIDDHLFSSVKHLTCSFGLTSIQHGETLEKAMERADHALYYAKREGKNSVQMEIV
jgi:diguanylate cyclase (GGDEF)-like protein